MEVYLRPPLDTFKHECARIMIRSPACCLGDHSSPYVNQVITSSRMVGARHVARLGKKKKYTMDFSAKT